MAQLKVYNGASWVQPNAKVRGPSSWLDPEMKYWTGSAWESLEAAVGPSVSMVANGAFNSRLNASCYAGAAFLNTGAEQEYNSVGSGVSAGNWLDSGSTSDVWVMWTRTSGTLGDWNNLGAGNNNVRLATTSHRQFRILRSSTGTSTILGYFRMYDAATGGNLLQTSSTVTWSAEYDFEACPLCCFTPETPVTLGSGLTMPISKLRVGDSILTVKDNELCEEPVTEIITRMNRPMFEIEFEGGRKLHASSDHPLHVKGKGAASIDHHRVEYKNLPTRARLEVGDLVSTDKGEYRAIVSIREAEYLSTVFTLGNSPFFANGLLVY